MFGVSRGSRESCTLPAKSPDQQFDLQERGHEAAEANRMIDWTVVSGGWFQRVIGNAGLIEGLDMAAALFRDPKPYEDWAENNAHWAMSRR